MKKDCIFYSVMGFLGIAVAFPFFLGSTIGWGIAIFAGGIVTFFSSICEEITNIVIAHKKAKQLAKEIKQGML